MLVQTCATKTFKVVLALGVRLNGHLAFDPGQRNIGLRTTKLLQCGFCDIVLACHTSGGSQHAVGANKIAALPDAVAGKTHCLVVIATKNCA